MEIKKISSNLERRDKVLDVGCANGYSTVRFAAANARVNIKGVDYEPEMVMRAKRRLQSLSSHLRKNVTFGVGDITNLGEKTASFNKIIVIRVLINLGHWVRQKKALHECHRDLKRGGLLILSEASLQSWSHLNKLRREWGLENIPMPSFNNYLDEEKLVKEADKLFEIQEIDNFSSTYYLGTRFLKPLLSRALGGAVDVANPDMEWNRLFAVVPPWGNYGVQKLFVLKKK